MKKVTYNTYSYAMSGMSREMRRIDGRDSAECQNWEKNDKIGIIRIDLSHKKTKKICYSAHLLQFKEP